MNLSINHTGRATLYVRGMISIVKVEVSSVSTEVGAYAQYVSAVTVRYVPKGARKARGNVETYAPSTVILDGWGHPDPAGMWDESTKQTDANGTGTLRSRYSSCDPRMAADFDTMLSGYLAKTSAKVICDLRGHNAMRAVDQAA